jgi:hypothetical protein
MLLEVIEKYWKDKEEMPIYEWLGISQVTWCQQKKTKIAKKHMEKIYGHFGFTMESSENELLLHVVKLYTNTV